MNKQDIDVYYKDLEKTCYVDPNALSDAELREIQIKDEQRSVFPTNYRPTDEEHLLLDKIAELRK